MRKKATLILVTLLILITGNVCFLSSSDKDYFNEEGILRFYKHENRTRVMRIDIEIAETKQERSEGLMNRYHMDKNNGMLFIFNDSKKRFFWMKNTYISLDIIYVNENLKIVSLQENTEPLLKKGLPSYFNAMYVVEVNAGFCNMYDIKVGDSISYKRI